MYIKAANQVSIQQPLCEQWMTSPETYDAPYARAIEPQARDYISPIEARRMGKVLKRALVTSLKTMHESGIEHPDAIITGTGLGCIDNTEIFLSQMCREGEQLLKPTAFMQSTHNTISSLLSIHTKTHSYNATYSQRDASFESALLDAYTQMRLGIISNALVGSHDELTPTYYTALNRTGYFGTHIASEASVAMMLSNNADNSLCRIDTIRITTDSPTNLSEALRATFDESNVDATHIDAVMTGNDTLSERVASCLGTDVPRMRYKHIFGQCYSSSALGLYAAAHCLARGRVPATMLSHQPCLPTGRCDITPRHILVVGDDGAHHLTLTILSGECGVLSVEC